MRVVLHSLDDQVKNEVASSDDTETFETLVSLPIKTDNCLQKRRVGENSRSQLSLKTGSGITTKCQIVVCGEKEERTFTRKLVKDGVYCGERMNRTG